MIMKAKDKSETAPPIPPGVPVDGPILPNEATPKRPPPYGTARPATPGDLPRVCDPLERADRGQVRLKVAIRNYLPQKTRYVLCADTDDAEELAKVVVLKANGLDKELDRLRKNAPKDARIQEPLWAITRLPD